MEDLGHDDIKVRLDTIEPSELFRQKLSERERFDQKLSELFELFKGFKLFERELFDLFEVYNGFEPFGPFEWFEWLQLFELFKRLEPLEPLEPAMSDDDYPIPRVPRNSRLRVGFGSGCGSGFEFLHDELDRDDIFNSFNWNVISDNLNLNDILRYFNPYDFLSSLCSIIQGGFDSNKFQNPPKIMKYIKPPSKTVLHVSDARTKHDISLRALSGLPSFIEQRAAFEAILTAFEESRGHAQQCIVDNTRALDSYGYISLEKLSPHQQWFQSTPRVPYYERADSEWRYRVVLEKYQAAEERYRVAGEQYQAAEERYRRVSKERKQAAEKWYAAAEERYQAVEELFQAASEQYEVASQKYEATSKWRRRVNSLQQYGAVSWRYEAASERQWQVTLELKVRPLMGGSPPISMGWYPADMEWYQTAGMEWYEAASKRHEAASKQRCQVDLLPRYQVPSRWYQGTLEQWCHAAEEQCRAAEERCRATSERYEAAKQEYEAASKLECRADSQQQDKARQRHQKALKWYHVALEQQYQATLEQRYRAAEERWHAAEEQYQAAEEQWQAVEKRYEAVEGLWHAATAQHHSTVKQVVSTLVLVSRYLQETLEDFQAAFEDFQAAFEDFQAAFEHLPRVRLNPPPIFLRVAGPISMDLRPFHRGKNVYSLGSMFLESLMCDFWISWDLRSYEVLVAAKIMHKGRLYPAAFTSKLSLLVKRLIKANLLFASQSYDKGRRRLALKSQAEPTGLRVSTTSTFRAGHDELIKRAVEGNLMQRSLIATISLGVRNLTSCITPIGERPECFGGFAEIWRAQLTSSNGKLSVAVKYLRLCVTEVTKHLYREIRIWQSLEHPHVLPLLGICYNANTYESFRANSDHIVDPMVSIGIVCPWMVNGTLVDYLKHRQTKAENIQELRLRLLIQVCSGLMYLHSKNIVHGDLHGGNILIDSSGCARLADFGLSAVVAECRGTSRTSPGGISSPHGGALRWAAPELFLPGGAEARLHPSADIYSIGGLILQACTGDVPYSYYNERRVLGAIIAGEKPRRPTNDEAKIPDALWSVIEECWWDDPLQRPIATALTSRLQAVYSGLQI
ncbi:hypothetical protein EDD85DRAFT_955606 [Armillaria nabsnona]|nr:hypothetical protein EDD85DRAFT_955606 [Armillaria nabsnona]